MCEYDIFVAKMGKYGIFVAQICKCGNFSAKFCKYALIDNYAAVIDSSANCAALYTQIQKQVSIRGSLVSLEMM